MAKNKNIILVLFWFVVFIAIAAVLIEQYYMDNSEFYAQKPFKFTIDTDMDGYSSEIEILLSLDLMDITYPQKYELDCEGDGLYELKNITYGGVACQYKRHTGNHQIWLRGDILGLRLCPVVGSNSTSVISIDDWGDFEWKSMEGFASDCLNLKRIPETAPNLNHVQNMSGMFARAKSFNQPLNHWNVSGVKTMKGMFQDATSFNQPLNNWDVSNVTTMESMFHGATSFNQPLDNWNVSNVTDMSRMFRSTPFNQPLEKWDVSNVTDMSQMFLDNKAFNQPLEEWDVSNVTDMSLIFYNATSFNQPIEKWNVSNVTDMSQMFLDATSFNQPLDKWDVSHVVRMERMFFGAKSFSYYPKDWVVPESVDQKGMFKESQFLGFVWRHPLKTHK